MNTSYFIVLLMLCAGFNCYAIWYTNNTRPALTNCSLDLKASDQMYLSAFYTLSDGTPHVIFGLSASPAWQNACQMWDVDLSNKVSTVRNLAPGYPGRNPAMTRSNTLVIGTSDPGHLVVYDCIARTTNYIKACSDRDYYSSFTDTYHSTTGLTYFGTYGGSAPTGKAEVYNPTTGTAQEFGPFDTDTGSGVYIYSILGDGDYIYGAVRTTTGDQNWYLSVITMSNTNRTHYWKTNNASSVQLWAGQSSGLYATITTNSVSTYYALSNGAPFAIGSLPAVYGTGDGSLRNDGVYSDTTMSLWTNMGWNIMPEFSVISAGGSQPYCDIDFKKTNAVTWDTLRETNDWVVTDTTPVLVQAWTNNSLILVAAAYGPVAGMVPHGSTYVIGPYKKQSTYDLLSVSATEAYLSGYHMTTIRWNPSAAWTRVSGLADYSDSAYNPWTCYATGAKYHYYLTRGVDGRIFIAMYHDPARESVSGGELAWYNPTNDATGSETDGFLNTSARDLKAAEGATKLVYVSNEPLVKVWNPVTFTEITNFTAPAISKVVESSNGNMVGIGDGTAKIYGFTTSGGWLWTNTLPATPWGSMRTYYERVCLGPDGYVWQVAGGILYRIDPVTGGYENIKNVTNDYNVVFVGGSAYFYGYDTEIWELPNLLTNSPNLTITGNLFIGP